MYNSSPSSPSGVVLHAHCPVLNWPSLLYSGVPGLQRQEHCQRIHADLLSPVPDLSICSSASNGKASASIWHGQNANLKQFPYVALIINKQNGGYCTASLIQPDIILTAAHCMAYEADNRKFYPTWDHQTGIVNKPGFLADFVVSWCAQCTSILDLDIVKFSE